MVGRLFAAACTDGTGEIIKNFYLLTKKKRTEMEEPKWQTQLTTVRERNRYAFDNSLFCDIEFSVLDSNEEKVTLKAHKYVLAISSPVFEVMFYGELAETGPTIDLPDCTKEGLQEMLHYVYSDEVNLTGRNVMDVLYLAQKYMMPFLENKCNEYVQKELRPEDVFIVLPQAKQIKNEKAELCCWNVVDFDTEKAVTSEPFLDISRELLCEVLSRETLHVEEIELFKAVDKWASNQIQEEELKNDGATKRKVLGEEVIRLVRFPVMSHHEFARFVTDRDILIVSEVNEIVKVLLSSATTSEAMFNAKKRSGQWNEKWSPNRFEKFSGMNADGWWNRDPRHCIQFQVSKPVFLTGFRLFACKNEKAKMQLKISKEVVPDWSLYSSPKRAKFVGSSTSSQFKLTYVESYCEYTGEFIDDSYYGFTVLLDDPVPLEPNEWYLIEAEFKSYFSRFGGSEGRDSVKCDDVDITFKNNASNGITTVEKGQFPSLLLKRKIDLKKK